MYIERNHRVGAKPPKCMCTKCFRIFAKRSKSGGRTERCTCGNEDLVNLDPKISVPKKNAGHAHWLKFFKGNYMLGLYYGKFRPRR